MWKKIACLAVVFLLGLTSQGLASTWDDGSLSYLIDHGDESLVADTSPHMWPDGITWDETAIIDGTSGITWGYPAGVDPVIVEHEFHVVNDSSAYWSGFMVSILDFSNTASIVGGSTIPGSTVSYPTSLQVLFDFDADLAPSTPGNYSAMTAYVSINNPAGATYGMMLLPIVSAVPIPGAVWLLGSGLAGLVGLRRKMR